MSEQWFNDTEMVISLVVYFDVSKLHKHQLLSIWMHDNTYENN